MSAVLKLLPDTALDLAWRNLSAQLARFERKYGKSAPGGDAPLEAAFEALLCCIRRDGTDG